MICPFCQADLDAHRMACPRCGAVYPGGSSGGAMFGLRLRTAVVGVFMMLVVLLVAVTCVRSRLPHFGQQYDMKSTEMQRVLLMMQQHKQVTHNREPPPPMR